MKQLRAKHTITKPVRFLVIVGLCSCVWVTTVTAGPGSPSCPSNALNKAVINDIGNLTRADAEAQAAESAKLNSQKTLSQWCQSIIETDTDVILIMGSALGGIQAARTEDDYVFTGIRGRKAGDPNAGKRGKPLPSKEEILRHCHDEADPAAMHWASTYPESTTLVIRKMCLDELMKSTGTSQ